VTGAFCRALSVVAVMPCEIARDANGFTELLDEGGSHRCGSSHPTSPAFEPVTSLVAADADNPPDPVRCLLDSS
jgi:hypothetical protein